MADLIPPRIDNSRHELTSTQVEARHDEAVVVWPSGENGTGYDGEDGGTKGPGETVAVVVAQEAPSASV